MSNKMTQEEAKSLMRGYDRTHISAKRMGKLEPRTEQPECFKPKGLWYGIGDSWFDWCSSEMPDRAHGYLYHVNVDLRNMLRLETPQAILAFTDEYGISEDWGLSRTFYNIDWAAVAEEYAGIEIAPYQWSLRMDTRTNWYYPWDVASGVVWDMTGVTVHKLGYIDKPPVKEDDWRNYYEEGEQDNEHTEKTEDSA